MGNSCETDQALTASAVAAAIVNDKFAAHDCTLKQELSGTAESRALHINWCAHNFGSRRN